MVKIKMVCSVCNTHSYYDVADLFTPRRCCDKQMVLDMRLDEINFTEELFSHLGSLGDDLRNAIILDSQKIICSLCGSKSYFYTTMSYGSIYDGYDICADCVRKHFDPVLDQVLLERKDG